MLPAVRQNRDIMRSRNLLCYVLMAAAASAATACGGDAPKTDTAKVIYEEDINARDTMPTPPPTRIGRMQLFSEPVGGTCSVKTIRGMSEIAREISYDADSPRRSIVLSIGRPPRHFEPLSLQIVATDADGQNRVQEVLYVGFSAEGQVTVGTRQFASTGTENTSERQPLSPDESSSAIRLARRILEICSGGK